MNGVGVGSGVNGGGDCNCGGRSVYISGCVFIVTLGSHEDFYLVGGFGMCWRSCL